MIFQLRWLWAGLAVLAVAGCASFKSSPPAPPSRPVAKIFHVVKPGENLFRIGKAYDVSFDELAKVNRLKDASQIYVGQKLLIPGANRQLPVDTIAPLESAPVPRTLPPPAEIGDDPLLWPVSGRINSNYGPRGANFHDGIDIAAPEGTPIRAIERGEVIYSDQLRGYGNIVILRHQGGMVSVYAHNQVNLVHEGQQVIKGEVIAKVGSTGRVTGPHLHFEIRKNNTAQDPLRYLPRLCCLSASDSVSPKD
ncbi:MAG: LysM peptidoglycan-binding domain-containing M23 family metallopeptidase [Candidatus Binatota bacterium]|nr:LysM peptidoglycan-binding domain-containing M23 family metallopeptidase [Candidatus Binatota bacterium]